jgi:hypothetical protein
MTNTTAEAYAASALTRMARIDALLDTLPEMPAPVETHAQVLRRLRAAQAAANRRPLPRSFTKS